MAGRLRKTYPKMDQLGMQSNIIIYKCATYITTGLCIEKRLAIENSKA
jgi:hypothetical protein